jgi:hypothetical protein
MDAKGWLIEYQRMCRKYRDGESGKCVGCPLEGEYCGFDEELDEESISDMVSAVEKWSKEHPFETNGMRFLDDNREYIRTYHRWENGCKPYIEVHIEADWWDAEYKGEWHEWLN